jgi:DNA ligase 1
MAFKPLLAATIDDLHETLERQGPMLASPKLDGVRCLIRNNQAVSRNLKPIPNGHVQERLKHAALEGGTLDGELIVGDPRHPQCFQLLQFGVMSRDGRPNFTFWVFDAYGRCDLPFKDRLSIAKYHVKDLNALGYNCFKLVTHKLIATAEELIEYEGQQLAYGFEGVMLRRPDGAYKQGRSTLREGILLKLKRFKDSEAIVIGHTELESNQNVATRDNLGHTVRSSHKAGKIGAGKLGSLMVRDVVSGVEFEIGTGFDEAARVGLWAGRDNLAGRLLTYKFQPTGVKDKPRFPVFKGWRHGADT